ncbi:hypothetical protein LTR70_007998 [Exophiala xenobiotica]|uniref:DUF1742-domain-containing protein n=1 Tax=Lithohypha guttulata TaxID=1690604 RepID=A0ABR0KLG4_9EURO|nr:hypothetical protein LTR24_001101 [Lithohypha guttulata]KAK5312743.1 hypothetical protein LTR70_007998 [Exophiala xenobiotica]
MANIPFPNEYNLRAVTEASSKPCVICHRPSTRVLISTDNKDFFYTCPSHLTDRGFASPIVDEKAEAEKKKQEQLAQEKEAIIKEYDEKLKKSGKEARKKDEPAKVAEEEKDQKLKALDAKATTGTSLADDSPRQFMLHRNFYQMRLDRRTNMEKARREQARMKDPTFFPAAPKGDIV